MTDKTHPENRNFEFVDTPAALETCCRELAGSEFIALDTEFLRERTYRPILGLIQLATPDYTACIDPLAFDSLEPLKPVLLDPSITKVVHAGEQDLEIFHNDWGEIPSPVFDTQIAATLMGSGESIGYAALVSKLLGVELDKSHSRTDWLRRPLAGKQLSYAADDVIYLARLYPIMRSKLAELGRLDWLTDDFANLTSSSRYVVEAGDAWRKVKGIGKLKGLSLAIACELAGWRESEALDKNTTRKRILADDALLELARLQPDKKTDLSRFRQLQHSSIQKQLATILEVIDRGRSLPRDQWPVLERKRPLNANQEALMDALMAIVRLRADAEHIATGTLASRKELELLVRGETGLELLKGWRNRLVGSALQEYLEGRMTLVIKNGKLTTRAADH